MRWEKWPFLIRLWVFGRPYRAKKGDHVSILFPMFLIFCCYRDIFIMFLACEIIQVRCVAGALRLAVAGALRLAGRVAVAFRCRLVFCFFLYVVCLVLCVCFGLGGNSVLDCVVSGCVAGATTRKVVNSA